MPGAGCQGRRPGAHRASAAPAARNRHARLLLLHAGVERLRLDTGRHPRATRGLLLVCLYAVTVARSASAQNTPVPGTAAPGTGAAPGSSAPISDPPSVPVPSYGAFTCSSNNDNTTCAALGDLYKATNGASLLHNTGWATASGATATNYCTFYGVNCSG